MNSCEEPSEAIFLELLYFLTATLPLGPVTVTFAIFLFETCAWTVCPATLWISCFPSVLILLPNSCNPIWCLCDPLANATPALTSIKLQAMAVMNCHIVRFFSMLYQSKDELTRRDSHQRFCVIHEGPA